MDDFYLDIFDIDIKKKKTHFSVKMEDFFAENLKSLIPEITQSDSENEWNVPLNKARQLEEWIDDLEENHVFYTSDLVEYNDAKEEEERKEREANNATPGETYEILVGNFSKDDIPAKIVKSVIWIPTKVETPTYIPEDGFSLGYPEESGWFTGVTYESGAVGILAEDAVAAFEEAESYFNALNIASFGISDYFGRKGCDQPDEDLETVGEFEEIQIYKINDDYYQSFDSKPDASMYWYKLTPSDLFDSCEEALEEMKTTWENRRELKQKIVKLKRQVRENLALLKTSFS